MIGPIYYPYYWLYRYKYWVIFGSFAILVLLAAMIDTYLFLSDISKIHKLAEQFSHGNFTESSKHAHLFILKDSYKNLLKLGENFQKLIQTHHNMTRFIAHEARTPLTTMKFAVNRINSAANLPADLMKHINYLKTDISDLENLVNSFLLYSQNQTNELQLSVQRLDIIKWLKDIVAHYDGSQPKIKLNLPLDISQLECVFDPRLLKHVIDNLLTNALKFTGNKIEITLEHDIDVLIYVDDNGKGVDESDREKIFTAFALLENKYSLQNHVGLGLNIANTIINLHNGSLTVSTSPWGGARFTIRLKNPLLEISSTVDLTT